MKEASTQKGNAPEIEITTYKDGELTKSTYNMEDYIPDGFDCGDDYKSVFEKKGEGDEYAELFTTDFEIKGEQRYGKILIPQNCYGEKFPVLYLLPGLNGQDNEWLENNVQQIIGNLILKKQTQPMIIVMPQVNYNDRDQTTEFYLFLEILKPQKSQGVMDYIETKYKDKVLTGKANTSIAGLSMGGLTTLYIGCNRHESFYAVGGFSPSIYLLPPLTAKWLPSDDNFTFGTDNNHFIFIGVGNNDNVVTNFPKHYHDVLDKNKNNNIFCTLPGGHDWQEYNGSPGPFKTLLYFFLRNKIFDNQY